MSQATLEELTLDLQECKELHKSAQRQRVQELLSQEMDRLRQEVHRLETASRREAKAAKKVSNASGDSIQNYQENITNYAWDQSDKFMKLYLTLGNLGAVSDGGILTEFTDKSVTVMVRFPNKTCQLHIARLCDNIVPTDCFCKKKSEYILVMMKKAEVGKTWPSVTEREKKTKEKEMPKFDENEDPGTSITKMLKNMYDEGDDEMKRNITKAWQQSQSRKEDLPEL